MAHNYESMAAEDLSAASAVDVAEFVTESIDHIIASEQVNSSIHLALTAIKAAVATAESVS